jgi:4-carboxymuconolactone decarboxylase
LAGLAVRKAVLGDDYVNQSLANADGFSMALQQMVTEHAWGDIWTRPGLERKTRSMINLGMLVALNRPHELKLHLRGALNNGVTREEIQEIFLQAMVYCGAPAGVDAFKIAQQVFAEKD